MLHDDFHLMLAEKFRFEFTSEKTIKQVENTELLPLATEKCEKLTVLSKLRHKVT
jgi:hypothetical protein